MSVLRHPHTAQERRVSVGLAPELAAQCREFGVRIKIRRGKIFSLPDVRDHLRKKFPGGCWKKYRRKQWR